MAGYTASNKALTKLMEDLFYKSGPKYQQYGIPGLNDYWTLLFTDPKKECIDDDFTVLISDILKE